MLECQNGQILFRLRERKKSRSESRSLKMMKSREDKSMLRKRHTNKNSDKPNLIRLINSFMIIKIWLKLFTVRCFFAMLLLNNRHRES